MPRPRLQVGDPARAQGFQPGVLTIQGYVAPGVRERLGQAGLPQPGESCRMQAFPPLQLAYVRHEWAAPETLNRAVERTMEPFACHRGSDGQPSRARFSRRS